MTKTLRNLSSKFGGTQRLFSAGFVAAIMSTSLFAQSPSPSPAPDSDGRYSIKASTEIGARWVDVNGFENKFRSDLNYKSGFRVFDSSIVIEDNGSTGKAFDSALIMASGWGSDPSGFFRANVELDGLYRIDTNIRRVAYFNALNNHSIGDTRISYDRYNVRRNFGDIDLTVLPENRRIRFRVGGSYNASSGPFTYTTRQSNAFPFYAEARTNASDFRAGADGNLLGFNFSLTYGFRSYRDRTTYTLTGPEEGSNVDTYDFISSVRSVPLDGRTHFGVLSVQRTFADKLDFTAKILHSKTTNEFTWEEDSRFYYNSPTVITSEQVNVAGESSRPQTRADLGMTWRATDKFRLSNTFTYDGFNLNGGNLYLIASTRAAAISRRHNYTLTRYRRYTNLFEGDYQFNDRVGVNLGYRYTRREFSLLWTQFNLANTPPTLAEDILEEGENTTHTMIAGTRIKPMKNWSIYADIERGKADNVITRAGNSDFTNFRIRNIMRFDKVSANVSYIDKQNEIPTDRTTSPTGVSRITDVSSRTFSATLDWYPTDSVNLSGGYNYLHLTSLATVRFSGLPDALSEYYVRDNYFFIDASVRPHKRISFFGSYRWNKDLGHGDRVIPPLADPNILLGGYPFDFKTPEVKVAIRLNKYIDWNIGYQYYDYKEEPVQNVQWAVPFQNYSAHMPYTSVRIYLGKGSSDR